MLTVKSNPAGVTLTGTDADGQTVTLNMGSNWFAQSATESGFLNIDVPGSAINTCKALNAGVATESQLSEIISEWGTPEISGLDIAGQQLACTAALQ